MDNKNTRYRCPIGHSYTEKDLVLKQAQSIEATLWVALQMMEERRMLLKKLSEKETNKGYLSLGFRTIQRVSELESHIEKLKELLFFDKEGLIFVERNFFQPITVKASTLIAISLSSNIWKDILNDIQMLQNSISLLVIVLSLKLSDIICT